MSRKEARELLMHLLFQMDAQSSTSKELKDLLLRDKKIPEKQMEYLNRGFDAVAMHLKEIDSLIDECSDNWSTRRMPKADLAVLRLGVMEILYLEDVPDAVAIDEAVLLAKKYGCDNSSKYINGVLGQIVKTKGPVNE